MAFVNRTFTSELDKAKIEMKKILDDSFQGLDNTLYEYYNAYKFNLLTTLLLRLYNYDEASLLKDLTKLMFMNPEIVAKSEERCRLLAVLWCTIRGFYDKDDLSHLMDRLQRNRIESEEPVELPFN